MTEKTSRFNFKAFSKKFSRRSKDEGYVEKNNTETNSENITNTNRARSKKFFSFITKRIIPENKENPEQALREISGHNLNSDSDTESINSVETLVEDSDNSKENSGSTIKKIMGHEVDPHRVLQRLDKGDRFNTEEFKDQDRWRNVTKPIKKFRDLFFKGRELTPEAKAWANKNQEKIDVKHIELNSESEKKLKNGKKLSKWQETKNYRTAINDVMKKEEGTALQTLNKVKQTDSFQKKLKEEIDKKTNDNGGREPTKKEKIAIEEELLQKETKSEIEKNKEEEKKAKAKAKEAATAETIKDEQIKSSPEFKKLLTEKLTKETSGKNITNEDIERVSKEIMEKIKNKETIEREEYEKKAKESIEYAQAAIDIKSKNPNIKDNELHEQAMNQAIESIKNAEKAKEQENKNKVEEKKEDEGGADDKKEENEKLKEENEKLKKENAKLKEDKEKLEKKVTDIEKENKELKDAIEKIKKDLELIKEDMELLKDAKTDEEKNSLFLKIFSAIAVAMAVTAVGAANIAAETTEGAAPAA